VQRLTDFRQLAGMVGVALPAQAPLAQRVG
jgi:hypothetical protein